MISVKKTCFIISPIGPDGSDTRRAADDLMELIIQPALEKYRFDITRADRIPRPAIITADIVELVQNAELCIIDLTGHNPNVFYECGRRHETGKPFIQLLKKGDDLPFDVSGIRTIPYDTSTPRSTLDSIKAIQGFVNEFEKSGYTTTSSGVSLSTIAASVDRIERRMTQLTAPSGSLDFPQMSAEVSGISISSLQDSLRPPRKVFFEAVSLGNIDRAASLLVKLRNTMDPEQFISAAGLIASAGNKLGEEELIRLLDVDFKHLDYKAFKTAVGGLGQYYGVTDREKEGLPRMKNYVEGFLTTHKLSPKEEAFLLNQLQRVLYGADDFEEALEITLRVLDLSPEDPSYMYNASLIYEKLGQPHRSEAMIDSCLAVGGLDADHLSQAVQIYVAVGRTEDAKKAFGQLAAIDRGKAAMLIQFDDAVKGAISGGA